MTPKQMGRLGVSQIQEAVLEILSGKPQGLKPEHISKAIGIQKYTDERFNQSYAIVSAILIKLKEEGYVERCIGPEWKLTEAQGTYSS